MKLSQLQIGTSAIIQTIDLQDSLRHRFMEMGLRVGTIVQICSKTLTSDNLYLKLDDTSCISLNKDEAVHIKILPLDDKQDSVCKDKISDSQPCKYPTCCTEKQ